MKSDKGATEVDKNAVVPGLIIEFTRLREGKKGLQSNRSCMVQCMGAHLNEYGKLSHMERKWFDRFKRREPIAFSSHNIQGAKKWQGGYYPL